MLFALMEMRANSIRQFAMLFALAYVQIRINVLTLMKVRIIVNDICTSVLTQEHGLQGQKAY